MQNTTSGINVCANLNNVSSDSDRSRLPKTVNSINSLLLNKRLKQIKKKGSETVVVVATKVKTEGDREGGKKERRGYLHSTIRPS